jgi:hypothetical protein
MWKRKDGVEEVIGVPSIFNVIRSAAKQPTYISLLSIFNVIRSDPCWITMTVGLAWNT